MADLLLADPGPTFISTRGQSVDEKEVDHLRVNATRRCDAVMRSLNGLMERSATLADILNPDGIRQRLLASIDFAAADAAEAAIDRLEKLLGKDGAIVPTMPWGTMTALCQIREDVATMAEAIAPYRAMRAELAKRK